MTPEFSAAHVEGFRAGIALATAAIDATAEAIDAVLTVVGLPGMDLAASMLRGIATGVRKAGADHATVLSSTLSQPADDARTAVDGRVRSRIVLAPEQVGRAARFLRRTVDTSLSAAYSEQLVHKLVRAINREEGDES